LPPTNALRPINPDNAWGSRITATAGTRLVAPYSTGTVNTTPRYYSQRDLQSRFKQSEEWYFFPVKSSLHPLGRHPARGVARSRFRALSKILDCSLP